MGNRARRQDFNQCVSRKHFLTTQDIRNVKRSVLDGQVKRHENDAASVDIIVHELRQESHDPILIYKPQGISMEEYERGRRGSVDFAAMVLKKLKQQCLD